MPSMLGLPAFDAPRLMCSSSAKPGPNAASCRLRGSLAVPGVGGLWVRGQDAKIKRKAVER